jgi:hypothetical protein
MKQKQSITLNEAQLRQIIRESIMNVLSEGYGNVNPRDLARSEGAHVQQYSNNMFVVTNGKNTYFFVDRNGKFYAPNGQPTTNVHTLVDADAESVANELNKALGNMFHWDMFRRQNNAINEELNEIGNTAAGQAALGALQQRREAQGNYNAADNVRSYAANARRNATQVGDEKDSTGVNKQLSNANQGGRDAYSAYNANRLTRGGMKDVIQNGWR